MGSAIMLFSFMGIFLYGLSWSSSGAFLKTSSNATYLPVLVGYSFYFVLVGFLLSCSLRNPLVLMSETLDFSLSGWGVVEMGAFGALLIAGLPFFILSQSRPSAVAGPTTAAGFISLSAGLVFMSTSSLWLMFISFEFLLLSALYMLLLTSKSERVRDAALEMFVWTLVGSAGLLTGLGLIGSPYTDSSVPTRWGALTGVCFLIGFGVKVPLWPATS